MLSYIGSNLEIQLNIILQTETLLADIVCLDWNLGGDRRHERDRLE